MTASGWSILSTSSLRKDRSAASKGDTLQDSPAAESPNGGEHDLDGDDEQVIGNGSAERVKTAHITDHGSSNGRALDGSHKRDYHDTGALEQGSKRLRAGAPSNHSAEDRSENVSGVSRQRRGRSSVRNDDSSSFSTDDDSDVEMSSNFSSEDMLRNPIKAQGEIHDLLLKLERTRAKYDHYANRLKRTTKIIQQTCYKLEKRVRVVADGLTKSEHLGYSTPRLKRSEQRPSLERSRAVEHVPQDNCSMWGPPSNPYPSGRGPEQQGSDRERWSGLNNQGGSVADPNKAFPDGKPRALSSRLPAKGLQPRSQSPPSPSSPTQATHDTRDVRESRDPRTWRPSVASPTEEKRGVQIPVAQMSTCDVLYNPVHDRKRTFGRKPRSLIGYPSRGDISGMWSDLLLTSSLDGDMQFWDSQSRSVLNTIPKNVVRKPWPEDIAWVSDRTIAVGAASSEKSDTQPGGKQVSLINVHGVSKASVRYEIQHLPHAGHEKGLTVVAPMAVKSSPNQETLSFLTGGNDHVILQWDMTRYESDMPYRLYSVQPVHTKHTSAVHAISFDRQRGVLWSGGADCRFLGWNMARGALTEADTKFTERVNHILRNPKDNDLFLINLSSKSKQFKLFDSRLPLTRSNSGAADNSKGIVLEFGFQQEDNVSRYIAPCWHDNGYLINMGTHADGKVLFWDIRYTGVSRGPATNFDIPHGKRVFKSLFLPNRHTLASISADLSMRFTDYTVDKDRAV